MAESPLPRPGFLQRARTWLYGSTAPEVPQAQAQEESPLREASPEAEGAPAPSGIYTRAYGGFSVDPRWLGQLALNDDTILQREGLHDLKLYDALLDDDVCYSAFQQRRLAVISRPWEVEPGDDSPAAKQAADHLREQLKRVGWDRICDRMLYGRWYGYAVGEADYEIGPDGKIWIRDILVPDRRWFGFTNAGELRLKTAESQDGEALPPNKFWSYRTGASHDFAPYGTGLAHWCYWPVWFKKNGIKFWAVFLEKFGMPTALGKFPSGAVEEVIGNLLAAASAVGRDSAVVVPDDTELELMASGRTGDGTYGEFIDQMNDALFRVILSQTGTSKSEAQGLGGSQSDVMKDVRDEVVRADSDMLHESFNRSIGRWLTEWNFGPNVAPPLVYRNMEDAEDLTALAERDTVLKGLGWVRTEESFTEIFGEGYERKEVEEPDPNLERGGVPPGNRDREGNIIDLQEEREKRRAEFADQDRAPLYVSRPVKGSTAKALLAWAAKAGIPNLYRPDDLHVTVLYSKAPVDWFEMADDWGDAELVVNAGGPRKIEKLGDAGAIVLRFSSSRLKWRHEEMVERGASHDYDEYLPHITLALAPDYEPPEDMEAFQGELRFGPEKFEALKTDWVAEVANREFSAEDLDAIDQLTAALVEDTDPIFRAIGEHIRDKIPAGVQDINSVRVALLEALEEIPTDKLAAAMRLPFLAARAAAATGLEDKVRA